MAHMCGTLCLLPDNEDNKWKNNKVFSSIHFAFEYDSAHASDIHKKHIGRRSLVKISGIYCLIEHICGYGYCRSPILPGYSVYTIHMKFILLR